MKTLLTAAIVLIAAAGPVSAQMYQMYQTAPQTMYVTPSWMMDDGSSSDHPIHMPGDISGERLNREYSNGIYTAPGTGLPAYPGLR